MEREKSIEIENLQARWGWRGQLSWSHPRICAQAALGGHREAGREFSGFEVGLKSPQTLRFGYFHLWPTDLILDSLFELL